MCFGYAVKQAILIPTKPNKSIKPMLSNKYSSQSGIGNAQVVENGNSIQVAFSHAQASVITNIFNQFEQQGIRIQQLQINQPALDKLEVQSVLSIN
ncbi:MAG: hypothetical protein U1E92_02675 [Moraxella osloensis]